MLCDAILAFLGADGSLASWLLGSIRHRLNVFTSEAQLDPMRQVLEFVRR
jgi:hypothetical protein